MRNYDDDLRLMGKNRYKILLKVLIFIVIGVAFFKITTVHDSKELEEFRKKYRYIETIDTFSGIVQALNGDRGTSVVSLTNGDKFVMSSSKNYDYKIFEMCCFINYGDSIFKKSNSDSIFILRDRATYYFVQGENIGKKYYSRFYYNPCRR
jgi:hypothetical protein